MKTNFQKIPLLGAIVFFLFFCGVFYFLYNQIEKNNLEAEKINNEWKKEASHQKELQMLNRGIKMVEKEAEELEKHLAKNSNLVPFLDMIEELAPKVGAKAETASVELSSDKLNLLVGLKAGGSFESIYKFLTLLENSPYELEFLSVMFSRNQLPTASVWEAKFMVKLLSFVN